MSQRNVIITAGLIIALMPFLGFPQEVDNIVYVVGGLAVVVLEYFSPLVYCAQCRRLVESEKKEEHTEEAEKPVRKLRKPKKKPVEKTPTIEEEIVLTDIPRDIESPIDQHEAEVPHI